MGPRQLRPVLGVGSLTLLGLGCIIGTGIFVLTGRAAATMAGPGLVISLLLAGGLCLLIALCYAELSSALPSAGSAYAYTYVSMGRFVGWVTGLLILLAYGLAAATVSVGWSGYALSVLSDLGIQIPVFLAAAPGVTDFNTGAVSGGFNALAMLGVAGATAVLCAGVSVTAAANNVLTLFKLGVIIAFIVIGLPYVNPENWTPFIPPQEPPPVPGSDTSILSQIMRGLSDALNGGGASSFGLAGVVAAAALLFFGFIGFEMPTTASEEAKDPRKVPFAMLAALVICVALYIGTTLVLTGIVPYLELNSPAPIAVAMDRIGQPWFAFIIKIAALAGLSTVMGTLLFAQTRVFLVMTRDGLMPPIFARLNNMGAPAIGTLATGAVVATVGGFVDLNTLADLTNIGMLGVFALVCIAVIALRATNPQLDRPFKTPLYPLTPIVGAAGSLFLLIPLIQRPQALFAILVFFAIGVGLFFISGAWRSVARAAQGPEPQVAGPRAPEPLRPTPPPEAPPQPAPVQPSPPHVTRSPPRVEPAPPRAPAPSSPVAPAINDVFISYKREEKERVKGIAEALRGLKLNVWFDANLTPGRDFDEEINREVRSARSVFVCWSTRAVESRWVRAEASVGHKRNVLVACFLEPCEPWTPFNLVHAEDLSGTVLDGANPGWVKLVEQIGQQCGRPGLGAYLVLNGDRAAMADWLRKYPDDPLAADVAARLG